ncbi:MAG: PRC-barrel domain-containing protein [Pseudomonadota bacterium]
MTRLTATLAALICGLSLSTAAGALDIPQGVFYKAQQPNQYLARDLVLGAQVLGPTGKIIGDIEDLIMNDDNQIIGVVMGVGGFLGVGEKRIGVRFRALTFETTDGKVVVSLPEATEEVLKAVPAYERAQPEQSLFDRAIQKAKELRDKTAATSADAYKKAKEEAGPAIERAKKAAGEAYEKAKDAAGKAYDKAKETTKPTEN